MQQKSNTLFFDGFTKLLSGFSVDTPMFDFSGHRVLPRTLQDSVGFGFPVTRHIIVLLLLPTWVV